MTKQELIKKLYELKNENTYEHFKNGEIGYRRYEAWSNCCNSAIELAQQLDDPQPQPPQEPN